MTKKLTLRLMDRADLPYFWQAHMRARVGKGMRAEIASFELNELNNLSMLRDSIVSGAYLPATYRSFNIIDPKPRTILSLPYCDRIVHQWLVEEFIKPYYMPRFIDQTYACIVCRGTHAASARLQRNLRSARSAWGDDYYVLKMDISRFFDSINQDTLCGLLRERITDKRLFDLVERIVYSSPNALGIPIGNYTSQYFANIYLNELDQWCKHELHLKYYLRYMDDFVILVQTKEEADALFGDIEAWLDYNLELGLNRKSSVRRMRDGVDFVGYITFPDYRLLRQRSKRKCQEILRDKDEESRGRRLAAWRGHAIHADSYHYRQKYGALTPEERRKRNNDPDKML